MILKFIVIIAITVVVMIGVMIPSVYAATYVNDYPNEFINNDENLSNKQILDKYLKNNNSDSSLQSSSNEDLTKYLDIRIDRWMPREGSSSSFDYNDSTVHVEKKIFHEGYGSIRVYVQIFQSDHDAVKWNESKITKFLQQTKYYTEEVGWFGAPSGCTVYLQDKHVGDYYHVKCVVQNYRIIVITTSTLGN